MPGTSLLAWVVLTLILLALDTELRPRPPLLDPADTGRVVRRLGRRRRAGRRVAAAVPEKENVVVLNHNPCRKVNTHCDKETVETAGRYEPVLALAPAPDLAL